MGVYFEVQGTSSLHSAYVIYCLGSRLWDLGIQGLGSGELLQPTEVVAHIN